MVGFRIIALLVNPKSPQTGRVVKAMQEALSAKRLQLQIVRAGTETEIDAAFASIAQFKDAALVVQADPFYVDRREQLAALAARQALPAIYEGRLFAVAGGLVSYGASVTSVYRQVGVYAGRILKGEKPVDLPVQQPTKFELVVNVKAAKAMGLTIPESFLARADEVIE
jgi:putative tryptophan/tyrosine transport system substrate-binding protein